MATKKEWISFQAIEVTQPLGTFYVGAIEASDLFQISFADVRRIEARDIENVVGIQRPLNPGRVTELKQYVTTVDASFPTSIIVAISSKNAEFKNGMMEIRNGPDVAKIIDGQHRIAGLEGYKEGQFQLNVTIFIDMDLEDQAYTFATINLKQTKVSRSLAYDLYELATSRSPQKTCHMIARLMNSKAGSPLKGRIKILGVATEDKQQRITQATFVDRLIAYICKDDAQAMSDRDTLKRGKTLLYLSINPDLIFRKRFIFNKDEEIAKIVWNYFVAVGKRWPSAWSSLEQGHVLGRTLGFVGLMRALRAMYNAAIEKSDGNIPSVDAFYDLLKTSSLEEGSFTTENYKPGSTGETQLYRALLSSCSLVDK